MLFFLYFHREPNMCHNLQSIYVLYINDEMKATMIIYCHILEIVKLLDFFKSLFNNHDKVIFCCRVLWYAEVINGIIKKLLCQLIY